jgi:DNA-binding GntR family transcriptional regulator
MSRPARPLPYGSIKKGGESRQVSFPDLAYGRLKNAIVEGGLAPGMQVAEQQIAHRLQMSRTPVYEAVMRLVQEGWLRLMPRRGGVLVLPLLVEDMRNVYEVLMSLEATAATIRLSRTSAATASRILHPRQADEAGARQGRVHGGGNPGIYSGLHA